MVNRFRAVWFLTFWILADSAPAAEKLLERFYDPGTVQEIQLEVKAEDLERMNRALPKRIFVPATFRWGEEAFENVGVRYKGNSSSHPDSLHKRGFVIDFSEFKKGQRFGELRHVALDNGIQFGSLFSERLITDALRDVGVKASRCNFVSLRMNGKNLGVYVNIERVDKTFLEQHFGGDRGVLFKVDEGGPGADLRNLGENAELYKKAFELQTGREADAYAALIEFIRAINSPISETELRRRFDLDAFVKTTAVLLFAGAFDQYTGWNPHNYYLYRDPVNQRWTYLPADLDVGFADRAFDRVPVLEGWNAAWPAPVPERPLLEQLLAHTNILREYRQQANVILEKYFRPEILIPKLRKLYSQVEKDLATDPFPAKRATNPGDRNYEDILSSMETFIRKRYAAARAQLDSPGKRPIPRNLEPKNDRNDEGPRPGPPSNDAPTELRVVKSTASSVELQWTDHADGEVAYVVQRSPGPMGEKDFANAIGQPGSDITTATDRNVQPGKSYRYRVYAVLPTPQGPRGTGVSNVIEVRAPEK